MNDLTVIMPVFNCAEFIEEAAQSVLDNAEGLLELIVVDDGSTDGSGELAAALSDKVRVIRQENAGHSSARNNGIAHARGELIGFLDSDDIWVAGSPDPRRAALEAGAEIAMGWMQVIAGDPPKNYRDPVPTVQVGVMLAYKEVLGRIPGMDSSWRVGEDVDWVLRLRDFGVKIVDVEHVCINYRLRPGSVSRDREVNRKALADALHASLVRRGKMGQ
jgi:glycosyltransferase involved in cell wall biosynthesis